MGFEKNYLEIDLSTGSTFNIALGAEFNIVYVKGTASGNVTIGVTGTPRKGMEVSVIFSGNSGINTLTILGAIVPAQSNSVKAKFDYFYNGSTWISLFIPSTDTAYVNNAQVLANAAIELTKLANLTASRIPQINSSGKIEASSTNISFLALLGAITVSAAQINNVGNTTANTADLNVIAGAAAAGITPTIISYLSGATSNIQAQLNAIEAAGGLLNSRIIVITNGVAFKAPANNLMTLQVNDYMLTYSDGVWSFSIYEG